MAQLQCMDVRLDTLSTELYQMNICVGRIARRQVTMGGFALKASPPPLPVLLILILRMRMMMMVMMMMMEMLLYR